MRLFKNRKQCLVLIRTPLKVQHLQGLLKRWDQSCVMARTRDPYCLRQPILPRRSVSLHNLGSSLCGIVNGPRATLLSSLLSKDAPQLHPYKFTQATAKYSQRLFKAGLRDRTNSNTDL